MTIAQMADDLRTMAGLVKDLNDSVIHVLASSNSTVSEVMIYGADNLSEWAEKNDVALEWLYRGDRWEMPWELYGYFNGGIKVYCLCDEETHDRMIEEEKREPVTL